jgi:mxaJ protein
MFSACLRIALAAALVGVSPAFSRELRVCADPNNLPFSNDKQEGFENRIVDVVAEELGATVSYTWWATRRGFIRNTIKAGLCDLVTAIPSQTELLSTTDPYYRSSYVFVSREADHLSITSFDDPALRRLTVGVQLIGDDGANSPPAHALARRGIVGNLRGYTVYGNYAEPNPAEAIVAAVADGEVDVAVVWGPLAGYFADKLGTPLHLSVVRSDGDGPLLPMTFNISMGVRSEDQELRAELDAALKRRKAEIDAILESYRVPRLEPMHEDLGR